MAKTDHLDLKGILHKIVDHLDLSPADRIDLHDSVQIHDDPAAQAEKDRGASEERAAKIAALKEELADLEPDEVPASKAPVETEDQPSVVPAPKVTDPASPFFKPAQGA